MKKIALLYVGLFLMSFMACKNDDASDQVFPLVGTWSPTKEVITKVQPDGTGVTDEIVYTDCQKESRWTFKEDATGIQTDNDMVESTSSCEMTSERKFSYVYNSSEKNIDIKYQGTVTTDKGKIISLDGQTLNLKFEDKSDSTVYKSTTYTFKRITQ